MPTTKKIDVRLDDETYNNICAAASKSNVSISQMVRTLIDVGLDKELAKGSIDFVREQIHQEIKATCFPQFERIAKLNAKIGYQSVSNFYLLAYIMNSILPANKKQEFKEIERNSKAMAIAYLKLGENEFMDFMESEDKALAMLGLK